MHKLAKARPGKQKKPLCIVIFHNTFHSFSREKDHMPTGWIRAWRIVTICGFQHVWKVCRADSSFAKICTDGRPNFGLDCLFNSVKAGIFLRKFKKKILEAKLSWCWKITNYVFVRGFVQARLNLEYCEKNPGWVLSNREIRVPCLKYYVGSRYNISSRFSKLPKSVGYALRRK